MVIINTYEKITKIKLSDKLKLYVSNVSGDWKESIIEDMLWEVRQQKVNIADNLKRYGKTFQTEYSISYLKEVARANVEDYTEYNLNSAESCLQCPINNMICLFFDYEYRDMPFLDWTSNCFDGRFCEEDCAEKVTYFGNFVNHDIQNGIRMNCIYTSNMNPREHTRVLSNLSFRVDSNFKGCRTADDYITELKKVGSRIGSILKSGGDYYKLDYTVNGVYSDSSHNQNHYLKTFTLLELVLLKPDRSTNGIDKLLVPYLDKKYGEVSSEVAKLLEQMRSKIEHGDFRGSNGKVEKFAQKFMRHFHLDYTEYSRLSWVLPHTCCLLDDLFRITIF